MTDVAANLARVRANIAAAAHAAGRQPEDIKLVAVSKAHPAATLEAALRAGQRVFGENTVQEALGKIARFAAQPLEWHFVGHLQSNKAKFIPGNFSWLHSLDSLKLAERLSRQACEKHAVIDALIEVNITRDPRKHGVAPTDIFPLLDRLLRRNLAGVRLGGLMAIGPYPAREREIRAAYARLRRLREDCVQRFGLRGFTELSMGMSGDYAEAVREGATMLRIGDAIFGARDYPTLTPA